MPRKEHFLLRNNGNRSEQNSVPDPNYIDTKTEQGILALLWFKRFCISSQPEPDPGGPKTYGSYGSGPDPQHSKKVLDYLYKGRLSRGRFIWLLAHPLSRLPIVSSTGDTQEDWEREKTCWRERAWPSSRIIRPEESLVFYKSFNILCKYLYI